MKKSLTTSAIQDQVIPLCESTTRHSAKPPPFVTRLGPTLLGEHRAVSYIPGKKPRKEPTVLPRLFIRGFGGSIKLDLGGVGIRFSQAIFAHFVADDSLLSLHVCCGDIALIEPAVRRMHDGNLLLLEIDGQQVIRRLRRQKHHWLLNSVDHISDDSVLLAEQAIQGCVIGFVRLFNKLRPVKYEGTDANYRTGFEIPTPRPDKLVQTKSCKHRRNGQRREGDRGTTPILPLVTKAKDIFSLSEIDKKIRYKAWPDK